MQCLYMFKKVAVVSLNIKQLSHKGLCTLYIYEETIRSLHQPVRTDLIFIVDIPTHYHCDIGLIVWKRNIVYTMYISSGVIRRHI